MRFPKRWLKGILNQVFPLINDRYYKAHIDRNLDLILQRNKLLRTLPGENILIMAPHVDDEILGCGGALLQYLRLGKPVDIIYLTDGAKRGRVPDPMQIASVRKHEAERVAELLQFPKERIHFLGAEDGNLAGSEKTGELRKMLDSIRPDTIFLPIPMDTHIDHRSASLLLLEAVSGAPQLEEALNQGATVYFYDVQSPMTQVYSNITLDTQAEELQYRELLMAYPSQGDLRRFGLLLHRYYGMIYGLRSAEAYIGTTFKRFCQVTDELHSDFTENSRDLVRMENALTFIRSHRSSLRLKEKLTQYHTFL